MLVAVTVIDGHGHSCRGHALAVALLTVPALTARLWADRVVPMMAIAAGIGAASGFAGLCAAAMWSVAAGGAIALATGAFFVASLALTARRLFGAASLRSVNR